MVCRHFGVAVLTMNPVGHRNDNLASCVCTAEPLIRRTCLSYHPSGLSPRGHLIAMRSQPPDISDLNHRWSGVHWNLSVRRVWSEFSGCSVLVWSTAYLCTDDVDDNASTAAGGMSRVLTSQHCCQRTGEVFAEKQRDEVTDMQNKQQWSPCGRSRVR